MTDIQTGKCQCGDISYSLHKNKIISAHHCHCKDCQRATGSGKATIIFIAKKHVDLIGEPKYFESKGTSGSHVRRGFCPNWTVISLAVINAKPFSSLIKK